MDIGGILEDSPDIPKGHHFITQCINGVAPPTCGVIAPKWAALPPCYVSLAFVYAGDAIFNLEFRSLLFTDATMKLISTLDA